MSKPIVTHTTHPAQGVVKRVCPASKRRPGPETPTERLRRLMRQAAANRLRVTQIDEYRYLVPSQRRSTTTGTRLGTYLVYRLPDEQGWDCECAWHGRGGTPDNGPFTPENPDGLCAHIAAVVKHEHRVERDNRRAARRLAAEQPTPPTTQERARAAYADLFGEAA